MSHDPAAFNLLKAQGLLKQFPTLESCASSPFAQALIRAAAMRLTQRANRPPDPLQHRKPGPQPAPRHLDWKQRQSGERDDD